jgi:hypothetical protein
MPTKEKTSQSTLHAVLIILLKFPPLMRVDLVPSSLFSFFLYDMILQLLLEKPQEECYGNSLKVTLLLGPTAL